MIDIDEKKYLEQTVNILNEKINSNQEKLKKSEKEFQRKKKDLGENYRDLSRNGDLPDIFNEMRDFEEYEKLVYHENKKLKLQLKTPYFARIDFKPKNKTKEQPIYIGIGNIVHNKKILVADWRAPICSMYYDFNLGDAYFKINKEIHRGVISLKRQYKIEDEQLLSYFDTDLTINDEILQDILSQNTSVKMKQIVSSIQKEQNVIVRCNKTDNMLVQGVAGSGKTSIALHRAAFLLYKYRKSIKSSDILILSPNNIFSSYISDVLPQLGEDNLVETTFAQIVRTELKRPVQTRESMLDEIATKPKQKDLNEISYKSSYEYLDSLLRFLRGPFLETFTPKDLSYVVKEDNDGNKETVDFPATQTKELFFKTFKGLDLHERISKIAWQYAMVFSEARHYTREQNNALKERFKNILYRFLPIRDVEKVHEIFMAREGLKSYKSQTIRYMDKGTYLAIKYYLYGFSHDFSAKYLIIDEMQDFTPVDIYVFKKLWNCPCIVVGDVNQSIEKNVSSDYLQLTADFLGCKLVELKKTYRSTKEIAKYANDLVGLSDIEFVNRSGEEPKVFQTDDQVQTIKNLINEKCSTFEHIAIICKCNQEAKELYANLKKEMDCKIINQPEDYNNRVLITTCATAKGIEFDAVIIPNASNENYFNTIDKNIIYVSSTRALHKLFFVTEKEPSIFVKNLSLQKV